MHLRPTTGLASAELASCPNRAGAGQLRAEAHRLLARPFRAVCGIAPMAPSAPVILGADAEGAVAEAAGALAPSIRPLPPPPNPRLGLRLCSTLSVRHVAPSRDPSSRAAEPPPAPPRTVPASPPPAPPHAPAPRTVPAPRTAESSPRSPSTAKPPHEAP